MVSDTKVLRRIFGSKRKEVTGGWGKLCSEKLNNFYSSPNTVDHQMKEDETGGHLAYMREMINFSQKTGREDTLERSRYRSEDNIKIKLR
jgi:hypothetical protein